MNLNNIPNNVSTIILFGSTARKDSDTYSDIDICVVMKDKLPSINLKSVIHLQFDIEPNELVVYSEKEFIKMLRYGSLFVWHLKLEGIILFDKGFFKNHINELVDYQHHLEELNYHSDILKDLLNDYKYFNIINELDLSMIFTICRNTCMILCHLKGEFVFGRQNVFAAANTIYKDLPLDDTTYSELALWKIIYERGLLAKQPLPSVNKFNNYLNIAKKLIDYANSKIRNK